MPSVNVLAYLVRICLYEVARLTGVAFTAELSSRGRSYEALIIRSIEIKGNLVLNARNAVSEALPYFT
ncbi:hypothetical protein PHIN6_07920 [Polynucleobacter sp. HIN6]|nr:hypothetical protein PHIN6_07920 [Polynucleobacter sp. HIN6]